MEQTIVMGSVLGILVAALIGLLIGAVAKWLLPGPDMGGWVLTCLVGLLGSWLGNAGLALLNIHNGVLVLMASVIGAMVLLLLLRVILKGSPKLKT